MNVVRGFLGHGRPRREGIVVIGAGQAGLATSWWLQATGAEHVVLERSQVGATWRERRWDSFRLVTPHHMLRLPGHEYRGPDPEGFLDRQGVVAHLTDYARSFGAPVERGVDVRRLRASDTGFRLETSRGRIEARAVIVAAGTFHRQCAPGWAGSLPRRVLQIGALEYRSPAALPAGAVLVVGSGQSGTQIADELHRAGRRVFLSTGGSARLPRRHRGRDLMSWLVDAGAFDQTIDTHPLGAGVRRRSNAHVAAGGSLDLRRLGASGVRLLGRAAGAEGRRIRLAADLERNLAAADEGAARFQQAADDHIAATGAVATDERERPCEWAPASSPESLDLDAEGVRTVIWASGLRPDYSWIQPPVFDAAGWPLVHRGLTGVPGLAFVGLHWMHRWSSALFLGVGRDARFVVSRLEPRRSPLRSTFPVLRPLGGVQ